MKKYTWERALFTAKGSTATATAYPIQDYMHIMLTLSSSGNANFTVKIQGSMSDTVPDFSAAQSNTNRWDYVQIKDYQSGANIDGDTGVSFAWTDDVRQFEINSNWLKRICATITTYAAGAISLRGQAFSNW